MCRYIYIYIYIYIYTGYTGFWGSSDSGACCLSGNRKVAGSIPGLCLAKCRGVSEPLQALHQKRHSPFTGLQYPSALPPVHPYLVVFQVPALDLLVLAAGEQVGAAWADGHAAHRADVTRQGQLQLAAGQVPDLGRPKPPPPRTTTMMITHMMSVLWCRLCRQRRVSE